ncbi:hypothetical protein KI387_028696, partial [Taxus chinensis]
MNPSVSCSSEERGEDSSWVCESWDNPPAPATAMSVGLETARQFHGRPDWDWDNTAAAVNNNPLLLSHHHHRHHHHHHHHEQSDSDEQKPPIMPPQMASFRQYNGMGLGFPGQHHQNHALGLLNSSGMRSFGDSNTGLPTVSSSSSFHPSLLYSEMPAFAYGGCDSRSQLAQMMSMQNHHNHHKQGGGAPSAVFHDIVKREDLEYQATMLNLGHRTYFSSEDSAVSRLYKRSRAIPPSSQVPRCQAEGCKADLSNAKHYHRRHKVCEFHSKAPTVITGGVHQRFCQQCSRFHALSEFDEVKRSCRKRLADHNRRRRKPQPNPVPSITDTPTAALKAEEDDHSNKNGSGSSDTTR